MDSSSLRLRRLLLILSVFVTAFCVYQIVQAVILSRTTGVLLADVNNDNAVISVSQPGHSAAVIGVGEAGIRLKPGLYQVAASEGDAQAGKTVQVEKKHTTTVSLKLQDSIQLRTSASINFIDTDSLIDYGVTSEQVVALKQAFFKYDKKAQNITVSDIQAVPHDPNSSSVFDTINFTATIDSKDYKASIQYSALDDTLWLSLYSPQSGAQIFTSQGSRDDAH